MSGDEKQYQLPVIAGADLPDTATFLLLNPEDTTTPPADEHGSQQTITTPELAIAIGGQFSDTDAFVEAVVAGTNVTVDNTDPSHPVVSSMGGGGGGGFPITFDDGTYTYTIDATGGQLTVQVVDNATGDFNSSVGLDVSGGTQGLSSMGTSSTTHSVHIGVQADETNGGIAEIGNEVAIVRFIPGTGDPNAVVTAPKGALFVDVGTAALWQNTDGVTAWTQFAAGSVVIEDGSYATAGTTTIPTSNNAPVSWGALLNGDVLLDLSTPTQPTVLTDGLYTFSVYVHQTATLTTPFDFELVVRASGGVAARVQRTTAGTPFNFCAATLTAKMTAGDDVNAVVFNNDGAVAAIAAIVGEVTRVN